MPSVVTNRPRISEWIGWMYASITILVLVLFTAIEFATPAEEWNSAGVQTGFFGLEISIFILLGVTTLSFYRTKYTIRDGVLHSWSPFAIINLSLKDIKRVERTIVPIHVRVGASFYSGYFYVPSLGWTRAIITNLTDGLLITAKGGRHYLITPSNPDRFAKLLKK